MPPDDATDAAAVLLTVGHGTLDAATFADLLAGAGVEAVVDVRRYPGSRRFPQFRREAMDEWLPERGITYRWEEALGGRRRTDEASPNSGLRDAGFRGYADYMRTPAFWRALDAVLADAERATTAVLCAESVWWRCHRRLIADAVLLVRQRPVRHVLHDGRQQPHHPTDAARVEGGQVIYDRGTDRTLPAGNG